MTLCSKQGGTHEQGTASVGWPLLKKYTLRPIRHGRPGGVDAISGFVATGAHHDVILVSASSGLYFVSGSNGGGDVSPGDAVVARMVTSSGPLDYDGGTNLIYLADTSYPDSNAVIAALETGGPDQVTFTYLVGGNGELLVVYSDGVDAHVVGINVNPSAITPAGNSSSAMTYSNLATVTGVNVSALRNWTAADFEF